MDDSSVCFSGQGVRADTGYVTVDSGESQCVHAATLHLVCQMSVVELQDWVLTQELIQKLNAVWLIYTVFTTHS